MSTTIGVAILAAGKGTRMKMKVPKPLAPVNGKCLVDFPLREAKRFIESMSCDSSLIGAIVGHQKELVIDYINKDYSDIEFAHQEQQNGTGDALKAYVDKLQKAKDMAYTAVICADTPLLTSETLVEMYKAINDGNLDAVAASFNAPQPKGYGRILRKEKGFSIVEEKDASNEERAITEVNSGVYLVRTSYLVEELKKLNSNNSAGEFYLTDIFANSENVEVICFENSDEFLGVNNLIQLSECEKLLSKRKINELMIEGVRFINPDSVYIEDTVKVGEGTVIYNSVSLRGQTVIGQEVKIDQGCILTDSKVEDSVILKPYSVLEEAHVFDQAEIGPFARLRPKANIGKKSKIGNFVEIKKSDLAQGVKVSHLSYVGDAEIGENTNIGCGFITCNYDGAEKHKTTIGKDCFIGSDSQTVAPVTIGDDCFVASSSTITNSMKNGAFAICRGKQVTKDGLAKRFIKKKD